MKRTSIHMTTRRSTLLLLLLLCLSAVVGLTACTEGELPPDVEVPAGMQYATGSGRGYHFFVPDGWQVDHSTGQTLVSVSLYSSATLSLAVFESERTPEEYWQTGRTDTVASFREGSFSIEVESEKTTLDGQAALRFVYGGTYFTDKTYRVQQYIAKKSGRLFVLTYLANTDEYESYTGAFDAVVQSFRFTDAEPAAPAKDPNAGSYEGAPEGMREISIGAIHPFRLFVPDAWRTDMQSGIVSAYVSEQDRSSISLTSHYPPSGVNTLADYFEALQPSYRNLYDSYTLLESPTEGEAPTMIGGRSGARYLMQGEKDGVRYRVLQVLFVYDSQVYSFTYTAEDGVFDTHMTEVEAIMAAITLA